MADQKLILACIGSLAYTTLPVWPILLAQDYYIFTLDHCNHQVVGIVLQLNDEKMVAKKWGSTNTGWHINVHHVIYLHTHECNGDMGMGLYDLMGVAFITNWYGAVIIAVCLLKMWFIVFLILYWLVMMLKN